MDKGAKILVTGATGFIGGRVCERLAAEGRYRVRALVHSGARAGRLSRLPVEKIRGDLLDRGDLERALDGCSAVIHLAAGSQAVLIKGTKELLEACGRRSLERFVLMSSVRVYGTRPPAVSAHEDAPVSKTGDPYGDAKIAQEKLVHRFHRRTGTAVVILRPPNVYGPHDFFSRDLLDRIENRRLGLVNGGDGVCETVYVDNLVDAVLLALETQDGVGETFFITDGHPRTWKECLESYAAMLGRELDLPTISSTQLESAGGTRASLGYGALKFLGNYLTSPGFAERLARVPLPSTLKARLTHLTGSVLPSVKEKLRQDREFRRIWGATDQDAVDLEDDYLHAQLRTVEHSIDKARSVLGYKPRFSRSEAIEITKAWLRWCGRIE